jgi:hypothetical protein
VVGEELRHLLEHVLDALLLLLVRVQNLQERPVRFCVNVFSCRGKERCQ